MENISLRQSLVSQATDAALILSRNAAVLLDLTQDYFDAYPVLSESERIRSENLEPAIKDLGALPYQLSDVVKRWQRGEEPMLSSLGIELTILNELLITCKCMMLFFISMGIDTSDFNLQDCENAHIALVRCAKLIKPGV